MSHDYDVIVAGAGIAGLTAALTAARLGRKTMVIAGDVLGGQLLSIEKVEGYPGFPEGVPGYDLCPIAQEQAMTAGAEFSQTNVESIAPEGDGWKITTGEGDMTTRAVIIATGSALKHLGVPGEEEFTGKGVSHCATCDGPLLKNKVAVVVGGGDSAMQEALTLSQFVSEVAIVNTAGDLTGQTSYRQQIAENSKIKVMNNSTVSEILGDAAVSGVRVVTPGNDFELPANGVFVFVGLKPETKFLDGFLKLDAEGAVETDGAMRTKLKGIAAAGTVRSGATGRAAASAGDGSVAAITVDRYLADGNWPV